jgi:hypothetical protein
MKAGGNIIGKAESEESRTLKPLAKYLNIEKLMDPLPKLTD